VNAVRLVGLAKHFGRGEALVRAVDDVDLVVAAGESIVVTGPSGCGKSTLLQLIGGLDLPSSGEVWIGGLRIDRASERARARLRRDHVGFVFQDFHLIEELTALENVELPALLAGVASRRARDRASDLLERVGLDDRSRHLPGQLSGGQQQRVAVARALVNRPDVLLADEPTGNLDSTATTGVLRLFETLRADGQTLIVVTHDPRTAATADRMVSMRDGALVEDVALGGRSASAVEVLSAGRHE
jgi:putative ABC transport system ATP-binding protein